jgi:hypothetical protein
LGSTDTTNWVTFPTITYESLFGLAHNQGQLVAVGAEGAIIRSLIQAPTNVVTISDYTRTDGDDLFLFTGVADQQFYLQSCTGLTNGLTNWSQGPLLEFYNGDRTLLDLLTTNTRPRTFYRTATRVK